MDLNSAFPYTQHMESIHSLHSPNLVPVNYLSNHSCFGAI